MNTELKARILAFYRKNPGVIETAEGLAQRLGSPLELVRRELTDHVRVGVVRERRAGEYTIYALDRGQWAAFDREIARAVEAAAGGESAQ